LNDADGKCHDHTTLYYQSDGIQQLVVLRASCGLNSFLSPGRVLRANTGWGASRITVGRGDHPSTWLVKRRPAGPFGYLAAWPTGSPQAAAPLNPPTGTVRANAAIVQAGAAGSIDVFAGNSCNWCWTLSDISRSKAIWSLRPYRKRALADSHRCGPAAASGGCFSIAPLDQLDPPSRRVNGSPDCRFSRGGAK
jgi:hypothetical protein